MHCRLQVKCSTLQVAGWRIPTETRWLIQSFIWQQVLRLTNPNPKPQQRCRALKPSANMTMTGNRRRLPEGEGTKDAGYPVEEATSGNSQRLFLVLKFERQAGWRREWDVCHALMLIAQSVGLSFLTWLEAMRAWHTNTPWFEAIGLSKICWLRWLLVVTLFVTK